MNEYTAGDLVEKAAAVVVLPVEQWTVIGFADTHFVYQLSGGYWVPSASENWSYEAAQIIALHGTDYTVLAPVPVTAKKVLKALADQWDFTPPAAICAAITDTAKQFGAEL